MATDTSEIDPIRGYLDAVQAYEQERTKAKTLIDRISTVATFRRKKAFSDDRATNLGARTRRQVAADKL